MKKAIIIVSGIAIAAALFVVGLYLTNPSTPSPTTSTGSETSGPRGGSIGTSGGQSVGVTQPATQAQQGVSVGVTSTTVQSPTDTMSVTTASGTPVTTMNFINRASTVQDTSNPDMYYLSDSMSSDKPVMATSSVGTQDNATVPEFATAFPPMPESGIPYVISYTESTSYFNITLLEEPIGATRKAAEQDLMNQLGVDKTAMCKLNYTVAVPWAVNQVYTSMDLGFSFCPGSVPLPD